MSHNIYGWPGHLHGPPFLFQSYPGEGAPENPWGSFYWNPFDTPPIIRQLNGGQVDGERLDGWQRDGRQTMPPVGPEVSPEQHLSAAEERGHTTAGPSSSVYEANVAVISRERMLREATGAGSRAGPVNLVDINSLQHGLDELNEMGDGSSLDNHAVEGASTRPISLESNELNINLEAPSAGSQAQTSRKKVGFLKEQPTWQPQNQGQPAKPHSQRPPSAVSNGALVPNRTPFNRPNDVERPKIVAFRDVRHFHSLTPAETPDTEVVAHFLQRIARLRPGLVQVLDRSIISSILRARHCKKKRADVVRDRRLDSYRCQVASMTFRQKGVMLFVPIAENGHQILVVFKPRTLARGSHVWTAEVWDSMLWRHLDTYEKLHKFLNDMEIKIKFLAEVLFTFSVGKRLQSVRFKISPQHEKSSESGVAVCMNAMRVIKSSAESGKTFDIVAQLRGLHLEAANGEDFDQCSNLFRTSAHVVAGQGHENPLKPYTPIPQIFFKNGETHYNLNAPVLTAGNYPTAPVYWAAGRLIIAMFCRRAVEGQAANRAELIAGRDASLETVNAYLLFDELDHECRVRQRKAIEALQTLLVKIDAVAMELLQEEAVPRFQRIFDNAVLHDNVPRPLRAEIRRVAEHHRWHDPDIALGVRDDIKHALERLDQKLEIVKKLEMASLNSSGNDSSRAGGFPQGAGSTSK